MGVYVLKFLRLSLAVLLLAAATGIAAQTTKMPPVDEGVKDATWMRFKARLLDALAKHDQKFVMSIVDSRIRNISPVDGSAEFAKLWEPQSADSPLWEELPKVLFLGGVYVKDEKGRTEFCAPYVHYAWPEDAPDDASGAIITKESLLKATPAASGQTLQTLSYDLVNVLDWGVPDENAAHAQTWVKLKTGNVTGFVPEEQIRSPLEYHACFAKSGTNWRMTAFEAGE